MKRSYLTIGGIVVAVILLISLNVVASHRLGSTQLDLTQDKLYTLSTGSKQVLQKLDEPVKLRLYFSEKLAGDQPILAPFKGYYQRVQELLEQYVAHSGGKLELELLDPEPFSEVEDQAVAAGLEGVPLPGTSDNFYFGLSGTGPTDEEQVLPFFQPDKEATLEYDLTKIVSTLAKPKKLVVGVLSSLPIEGEMPNPFQQQRQMPQPWFFVDQLRQMYETKTVPPNAREIPAEVSVLLIVHPKNLPQTTLYAIDQFVLGGGRVMLFVDPYCEADIPMTDPSNPLSQMTASRASDLEPLLTAWGVEFTDGMLAADMKAAMNVTYANNRGRDEAVAYVVWLRLMKDNFDQQAIVTNQLRVVNLLTAGFLSKKEGATTEFEPLFETSTESRKVPVSEVQFQQDPKKLLASFFPEGQKLCLAARVSGAVRSAFPTGRPEDPTASEEDKAAETQVPHLAESKEPIQVVVVSDCDMLSDRTWVQVQNFGGLRLGTPSADNFAFVANTLDFMQGSTEMVSLRSRGGMARPFKVVEDLRRDAGQRLRAEEQRLEDEVEQAKQKINELQSKKSGQSTLILSPEQQAEVERLREQVLASNKKLREVRHGLNADIDRLGGTLKFVNIGLIPLLIGVFAVGMGVYRGKKKRAG